MSTLPGQASKGEKTKSKFQSLDINSLYRVSRGENLEKQQQKSSSVYIKHGMQSLGKVPNARRAPANLPSLKAEYSGSDAAVPLVPPGAQGWGKQDANAPASATAQPPLSTSPSNPPSQNSAAAPAATPNQPPASQQISQHQAAIALPVTNPIPPHPHKQSTSSAPPAPVDKLWSSVMSGQDVPHPPLYHSPQFQHEFPSLSAGDGGPTRTGSDAPQYPSGLSLRPQTEGSWTQGGQRPVGATGVENAGQNRPNSGPQGVQPQHSARDGQQPQQQQFPPQMRGVMPSFMYKGSGFQQNPQGNGVPPNSQNAPPPSVNGRGNRSGADGRPPRLGGPDRETDEALPRPIIKEEELNRMDEIGKDMGWAESDEIDYNQKLAFSDDEGDRAAKKDNKRRHHKEDGHGAEAQPRQWGAAAAPRSNAAPRSRPTEEEDIWTQRRNQTDKEVEIAVQRAKQRKEEEEKRFQEERKQAAAKKLMELEEKIQKRDRDTHEAVAAPQKTSPDKEQTANHEPSPTEEKTSPQSVGSGGGSSFRQLTQIEGKNFPPRKHNKPADTRESNAPFSKNFQNDLPPRFLKHQRNNSSSNLQQQQQQQFDSRWSQNATKHQQGAANNNRTSPETERSVEERKEYARQSSEDSYRSSHHSQQEVPAAKSYDAGRYDEKSPPMRGHKDKEEDKRPQQQQQQKKSVNEDWSDHRNHPISSEKGRHSRDYMSPWSEYDHSTGYEEAKKREERRVVPGPITKERIEAEDLRSEKRNLTQLKRGQPVEVRSEIKKLEEEKKESQQQQQFVSAWADSIPPAIEEQSKKLAEEKKNNAEGQQKTTVEQSAAAAAAKKQDKPSYGQKKGWAGNNPGNDYHSARGGQPWQGGSGGRRPHSRNRRSNRAEFHGTDSDGSQDDHQKVEAAATDHHHQKSPKSTRRNDGKPEKFGGKPEKQEKRENYVPRGEPSRHGRGGGNFRSGGGGSGRMSSMGKKIDGYGPPPAKSPFGGHHDDKEKKPLGQEDAAAENVATVEDKIKQNQQALAAGIIGKRSEALPNDDKKSLNRPKQEPRKNNNKPNEVIGGSTENAADKEAGRKPQGGKAPSRPAPAQNRGRNNTPRGTSEKRYEPNPKLGGKKDDKEQQNSADVPNVDDKSENNSATNVAGDSEGFQEVKSKKTAGKERQKSSEDKSKTAAPKADTVKDSKPMERDRKSKTQQLTPQQIQNIPSLMATPVNPPPILPKSNFDNRGRQTSKLPPRFAKQKLQKQAMQQQQQQHLCDLNDISKVNQNAFGAAPAPPACAWDKPLVAQLRGLEQDNILGVSVEAGKGLEPSSQLSEKLVEKPLLDGTTAPVNTIIFENTNFKSAPGARAGPPRNDKPPRPEAGMEMASGFGKSNVNELLQQQQQSKNEGKDAMQLPLFKEDMKIDFFNADLQFSDDKASKSYVAKSIHAITSGNNTVDSLDIKIASVKKVWETSEQEGEDNQMTFGGAQLDSNVFNQSKDVSEDNHEGYSPSANQTAQTNVCKVKPTQQVSGGGQTAMGSTHQAHAGMVAASLMGNPLSPPPMPPVLGAGVGMGPQFTANQHLGYQTGLSGSTQYGISAIPSPPTVPLVYNSSQQLQSAVQTANLYGAFQLDQLGGQGRSQFSQYANYHGLGQTPNSPYTTPNVYLQTPPHPPPPPAAQPPPPPPELYQNINNFRLSATTPFGQNQQLNNPTTVLISSTSNSLMSASVKPSGQQISAIGTKAGGVGQAYQQQSQQGQQVYMAYDPSIQANYLASNAGVMQRAPVGPAQNNVVPGLQPSSSYYSGSTGGQSGFFQQPNNNAQLSQHQAGYGLQGNMFGTHNQSHTNTALQNYNSHFLTTPMQMAAALNAQQQFRSNLPAAYMKSVGDQSGRSQQLKSPSSQEVLSSVFNSGPQIPSPKSRQNMKHPPQQSSPTSQHKFNMYQQGVGGPSNMNMQRYPTPIQRPINFQQMQQQQQNSANQKHRNNPNGNKPRYYGNQNHSLSAQSEKCDDAKINDGVANAPGAAKGVAATGADGVKENLKEEAVALKD